jgi:hypothetical protein
MYGIANELVCNPNQMCIIAACTDTDRSDANMIYGVHTVLICLTMNCDD